MRDAALHLSANGVDACSGIGEAAACREVAAAFQQQWCDVVLQAGGVTGDARDCPLRIELHAELHHLVAQAEHDPLAASVLVTPSERLADEVEAELDKQVYATKHTDRIRTALGGAQSAIVLVDDLEQGLAVVDAYGAEHLEIQTVDAASYAARVRNAGAIFVGPHAPVSLGDYCAGSNHVLPTGGTARFSAGLSALSFQKRMSLIDYSAAALAAVAPHVSALGGAEDLHSHVEAVQVRVRAQAQVDGQP